MSLKTFVGSTMAEALRLVRAHFGDEGVILSTRTVDRRTLPGIKAKTLVEITAARAMEDLPPELQRGSIRLPREESSGVDGTTTNMSGAKSACSVATAPCDARPVRQGSASPPLSGPGPDHAVLPSLSESLRRSSNRLSNDLARDLLERARTQLGPQGCRDRHAVRALLREFIESMLPRTAPARKQAPGRPMLMAMVGPSGVGKTTTVAKIAANLVIGGEFPVGLVTLDIRRIGAVAQLETYADVLGIPLEVASGPAELALSVRRLSDRGVVLIDTPGCAAREVAGLRSLRECLARVTPDEVHLVLSSSCDERALHEILERYAELGVNRLIFTRLDEAVGFSVVLGALHHASVSLSYVTTGPGVPDDIQPGEAGVLADLILGQAVEPQAGGHFGPR